jgi:hypothetical protein
MKRASQKNHLAKKLTHIAVIGASYAGLAFASMIHNHYPNQIVVHLFELCAAEQMASIDGSLVFHNKVTTLNSLNLPELIKTTTFENQRTSKNKLLHGLASSLPNNSIHYHTKVHNVEWDETTTKMVVMVEDLDLDKEGAEKDFTLLTFDIVVGADGLLSKTRDIMLAKTNTEYGAIPYFLLGNSSRQYGRELCFGLQRTRYGASLAMADAVKLGRLLGWCIQHDHSIHDFDELVPFTISDWKRRRRRNNLLIITIMCGIFWLIIIGFEPKNVEMKESYETL